MIEEKILEWIAAIQPAPDAAEALVRVAAAEALELRARAERYEVPLRRVAGHSQ